MKQIATYILLFTSLYAGAVNVDYRLSVRSGAILNDGKVEQVAPHRMPTIGAEFAIGFHPNWQALEEWNRASIGVAVSYGYMGNPMLGHAIAPYAFLDIPLVRRPHFVLGLRPGIGCALMTKTFRNTTSLPYDQISSLKTSEGNYCIGSVFNFYFPEAFYMDFPIRNGWAITLGGGWYHISNGSTIQPNSGYNMLSGEIGVRKTMPSVTSTGEETAYPGSDVYGHMKDHRPKNWEVDIAVSGGFRQVYYKDMLTFGVATFEAAAYWRAHNIFRLGGGVDVFYDGAYTDHPTSFKKTDLTGATTKDCFRVGLSIQPEFVVGHFIAGFHVGAYMYDPVKRMEGNGSKGLFYKYDILHAGSAGYPDGWLYTSIVLRYHLPYHLMLHAEMKAHLTKVEFVTLGLGVWI